MLRNQEDKQEEDKAEGSDDEEERQRMSKRKRKLESRLKIAELKQTCPRPEVVEVWDVTAQDPRLLVYLKVHVHSLMLHLRWTLKGREYSKSSSTSALC